MPYKFWYERYSVAGIMPDGRTARFDTDKEYIEAFDEEIARASLFLSSATWTRAIIEKGKPDSEQTKQFLKGR